MAYRRPLASLQIHLGTLALAVGLLASPAGAVGHDGSEGRIGAAVTRMTTAASRSRASQQTARAARLARQRLQRRVRATRVRTAAAEAPVPNEHSARLNALAERAYEVTVRTDAYAETAVGVRNPEADTRMPDYRPAAVRRNINQLFAIGRELHQIDPRQLTDEQLDVYGAIESEVDYARWLDSTRMYHWNVDSFWDAHQQLQVLGSGWHTVSNRADVDTLIARYAQVPAMFQGKLNALRRAAHRGQTMPRLTMDAVVGQLDEMIASPGSFAGVLESKPAGMSDEAYTRAQADLNQAIATHVVPTLTHYRDALRRLPTRESIGLFAMPADPAHGFPGGERIYRGMLREYLGTDMDPRELHDFGVQLVGHYRAELDRAGRRMVPELPASASFDEVKAAIGKLPSQNLSREAYVAKARSTLRRSIKFLRVMGISPKERLPVVIKIAAPGGSVTAAAFNDGAVDAATGKVLAKGTFEVNPNTQIPAAGLPSMGYHEVAGHGGQWMAGVRRNVHRVARVVWGAPSSAETGGVYAEMMANAHGEFTTDEERFGHFNEMQLRAVRIVVDTGIHALGWTREQAVTYLMDNTTYSREASEHEIDRYIAAPGQATSYMYGASRLMELRGRVQEQLGARFDEPSFNRLVLSSKTVPPSVMELRIQNWVSKQQALGH